MTKEKLKKEAVNWLRKYLLCCNCEKKCNCIDSNSYCEEQVLEAYVDSAEPREKQIEINAEQIRALQKQNGEQTDRVKELEQQIEQMKIKWHDLRKDPNDLPKESCSVLVIYEYDDRTYTDNYINDKEHNIIGWESEYKDPYCSPRVIAWIEKPMFKEIKEK